MFSKLLPVAALTGILGLISLPTVLTTPTSAQEANYQQVMQADNFSLWNSGEMSGIAFDVWRRPAASGGGSIISSGRDSMAVWRIQEIQKSSFSLIAI